MGRKMLLVCGIFLELKDIEKKNGCDLEWLRL